MLGSLRLRRKARKRERKREEVKKRAKERIKREKVPVSHGVCCWEFEGNKNNHKKTPKTK